MHVFKSGFGSGNSEKNNTIEESKSKAESKVVTEAQFLKPRTFIGHSKEITCIAVNAKGTVAISGSRDKTLCVWSLTTGECLKILTGHKDNINSVAISADGNMALSGSADNTLRVWNLLTMKCVKTLTSKVESIMPVNVVALSADGNIALSGSRNHSICVWDLKRMKCIKTLPGHTDHVLSVSLSADGRLGLSGSWDKTLRVWDIPTGKCLRILSGHNSFIWNVALSTNGSLGISGGEDKSLCIWDINTGKCLKALSGQFSGIMKLALCGEKFALSSGDVNSILHVLNIETGTCEKALDLEASVCSLSTLIYNEQLYALIGLENKIDFRHICAIPKIKPSELVEKHSQLEDKRKAEEPHIKIEKKGEVESEILKPMTLSGHTSHVYSIALNGNFAVSGSHDNTLRLWDLNKRECVKKLSGHSSQVNGVAINSNGTRALSGSKDKTIRLWNLPTGECIETLSGHASEILCVALSANGNRAVSGGRDKTLCVWDLNTKEKKILKGHTDYILSLALSTDGKFALSGGRDRTLRMWDVDTGKCLRILPGHTSYIWSVALNVDGTLALSGSWDKTIRVWNMATGECIKTLSCSSRVYSVALSIDGNFALSGSNENNDDKLCVWNLKTWNCDKVFDFPATVLSMSTLINNNQLYVLAGLGNSNLDFRYIAHTKNREEIKITQEQTQLIETLQRNGVQQDMLQQVKKQLTLHPLTKDEIQRYKTWMESFSLKINQLEAELSVTHLLLARNPQAQHEQAYIDRRIFLKEYQFRLQRELSAFMTCYFLAPLGIFKLEDNLKETAISAIGSIPIVGNFLKVLTAALSMANRKLRIYQINRIHELFEHPQHITELCCAFARQLTIAKEEAILQYNVKHYQNKGKVEGFFRSVKEALEHPGVTYTAGDKLAVLDLTFLLEQILTGEAKIDKNKDIATQWVEIVLGSSYKPRIFAESSMVSVTNPPRNMTQRISLEEVQQLLETRLRQQSDEFEQKRRNERAEFEKFKKLQEEREKFLQQKHEEDLRKQREEIEVRFTIQQGRVERLASREELARMEARLATTEKETDKLKDKIEKVSNPEQNVSAGIMAQAQLSPLSPSVASTQQLETSEILSTHNAQIRALFDKYGSIADRQQNHARLLHAFQNNGNVDLKRFQEIEHRRILEEKKKLEEKASAQKIKKKQPLQNLI